MGDFPKFSHNYGLNCEHGYYAYKMVRLQLLVRSLLALADK